MKFATLLFFFVFTHAYASPCAKEVEAIFVDEESTHEEFRTSEDHFAWSAVEKKLIYAAIKGDSYHSAVTLKEALQIFGDFNEYSEGKPGNNAGTINYYRLNGKVLAQVHYWPGDNEYGAIFEMKGSQGFQLLGTINDGDISCE